MEYLEENGDKIIFEKESLWEESVLDSLKLKRDMLNVYEKTKKLSYKKMKLTDPIPNLAMIEETHTCNMFDYAAYQLNELQNMGHTNAGNILVELYTKNTNALHYSTFTIDQSDITKKYMMLNAHSYLRPGVFVSDRKNPFDFIAMVAKDMNNGSDTMLIKAWFYRDLHGNTLRDALKEIKAKRPIIVFGVKENRWPKFSVEDVTRKMMIVEEVYTEEKEEKEDTSGNKIPNTKVLYDATYAKVEKVLSTTAGSARYQRIIENFLNKNFTKLTTSGPVHKLVFGTLDQKYIFDLFNTSADEIKSVLEPFLKSVNKKTNWKLLTNNPVYFLIASACFYYHKAGKKKELDVAIIQMALAIYWSVFVKYWPYGAKESIMNATIESLSGKFLIKQSKNLLDCLQKSGQNGFNFYAEKFDKDGPTDFILCNYIQRVHHDQNSMLKNIKKEYEIKKDNEEFILTRNDKYDEDTPILDENVNATTTVDIMVAKIAPQIINNPIKIQWCKLSAQIAGVSQEEIRTYVSKIVIPQRSSEIKKFIECILHSFLYTDHHEVRKLKSQEFLAWARSFIKKTNSKNQVIQTFCAILNKWGTELGIFDRFGREGTRINYKKAIYFYFIFSIMNFA